MTIPDEAVEAAFDALYEASNGEVRNPMMLARAALTAAAPHIRAEIAAEIRDSVDLVLDPDPVWRLGILLAAHLAEGNEA